MFVVCADRRVPTYEDYGFALVDRTNGKTGGGDGTEYRLHNPLSLLFSSSPSDSSMHIDGIGGGHLVRNLASAAQQGSETSYALARTDVGDVANRFRVVDLYRAFVKLEKVNGNDETISPDGTNPSTVSRNTYILEVSAPSTPNDNLNQNREENNGGDYANDDAKKYSFQDLNEAELKSAIPMIGNTFKHPLEYNHNLLNRDLDALGGGHLLRSLNFRDLDAIGGGHLLRGLNLDILGGGRLQQRIHSRDLDALGGGHLLRDLKSRDLDALGGGHLLKRLNKRDLDLIGGGNLLRSLNARDLDALGGGNLLRGLESRDLDALGGGHLLRSIDSRDLDALGGGHLLRSLNFRDLDAIGGGNLLRSLSYRDLDALGGGHLLRSLDSRELDALGEGNVLRSLNSRDLDAIGGGNLLRSLDETKF